MRRNQSHQFVESLEPRNLLAVDLGAAIVSPPTGLSFSSGAEVGVNVLVQNAGSEEAEDCTLQIWAASNGVFDEATSTLVASRTISSLDIGEIENKDLDFVWTLGEGGFTLFARILPASGVFDSAPGNDLSVGVSVTVGAGSGGGDDSGGDDSGGDDSGGDDSGGDDSGGDDWDDDDSPSGGIGPVDATISITTAPNSTFTIGREQRVYVNARNLSANRIDPRVGIALYASTDSVFDATQDLLLGTRTVTLHGAFESEIEDIEFRVPATLIPGTYKLIAVIDQNSSIAETDESNNVSEAVSVEFVRSSGASMPATGSDLIVSITSPSQAGVLVRGRQARASILVSNLGSVDSSIPCEVRLVLSTDTVFDESDLVLRSRSISSIDAGESELEDIEFTVPASLDVSNFWLIARVDSTGRISESSETNNNSGAVAVTLVAAAGLPTGLSDLSVGLKLEPGDDNFRSGNSESVFVNVSNSGGKGRASTVRLYASSDDTADPAEDRLLRELRVGALNAGQTLSRRLDFVMPTDFSAGSYRLYAVVDDGSSSNEANESNNKSSLRGASVDVGSFDLAGEVSRLSFGTSLVAGMRNRGSANITYRNEGADRFASGVKSTLQAFLRPVAGGDDIAVSREKIESLSSGDLSRGKTASLAIDVPTGTPAGAYRLVFKIDSRSEISEIDESNNEIITEQEVVISNPFADLSVSVGSTNFTSAANPGDAARGSLTLVNLGNVNAKGNVTLTFSLRDAEGVETAISSSIIRKIDLKPAKPTVFSGLTLRVPDTVPSGSYTIVVRAAAVGFTDNSTANNAFDVAGITIL